MEIYFCDACGKRVTEAERDSAPQREGRPEGVLCRDCVPKQFRPRAYTPPTGPRRPSARSTPSPGVVSSAEQHPRPSPEPHPRESVRLPERPEAPAPASSQSILVFTAVGGMLLVVALLAIMNTKTKPIVPGTSRLPQTSPAPEQPLFEPTPRPTAVPAVPAPYPSPAPTPSTVFAPAPPPISQTPSSNGLNLDLGGGLHLEFVLIPSGTFIQGDPNAQSSDPADVVKVRQVTLTRPFYLSKYEVTQEQFEVLCPGELDKRPLIANLPMAASWMKAGNFCEKLSQRSGRKARLPTEAEWEYACRAGCTTDFPTGNAVSDLNQVAWYKENSTNKLRPVGRKKPNAWGLYDMQGNRSEWCSDFLGPYAPGPVTDPQGPATGIRRVSRGGSISTSMEECRAGCRNSNMPGNGRAFRVVVESGPASPSP